MLFIFFKLPIRTKYWTLIIFTLLIYYRCLLYILPFKAVSAKIGKTSGFEEPISNASKKTVWYFFRVIKAIRQRTSDRFKCLEWTLTAAYILRLKKIPYILSLGLMKGNKVLKAHSWIKAGGFFVTGHLPGEFTQVGSFYYRPVKQRKNME